MNKVAHYLQEHLLGEVFASPDVRRYFSTDASIFSVTPSIVVYPRNENDVRKIARFSWQLAERGRVIPITARGSGTDWSGAALGDGIMVVFPAHMHKILELDPKTGLVAVEPGINYGKLQQALHTHGRFVPAYPASVEYSTVGGAVANNAGGEKSYKYGDTREYTRGVRAVLANGELIETGRISKRELSKKMGLATFEGEVYRAVDALIEENTDLIKKAPLKVSKNSAGYALNEVKRKDGSFDLTPLLVGSQGTLGIITEVMLDTETFSPETTVVAAFMRDADQVQEIVHLLGKFSNKPSAIELVDDQLLEFLKRTNPNQLTGIIDSPFPKFTLLIEFDNDNPRTQKRLSKKLRKLLDDHSVTYEVATEEEAKERLWKIRQSVASMLAHSENNARPLPFIDDGVVPVDMLASFTEALQAFNKQYNLHAAVWGHAGDANLRMQPVLDLSQVGDRQKIFKLMDEYYALVFKYGGTTSGEYGDGRVRGPLLKRLYGEELYEVFTKLKKIFDPYNTLNPGVKIGIGYDDVRPLLRQSYTLGHFYDHMPRT